MLWSFLEFHVARWLIYSVVEIKVNLNDVVSMKLQ